MAEQSQSYEITETGERIVFGFPGQKVPNPTIISELQKTLQDLIQEHQAKVLAMNARDLQFIPSQMLGFLIQFRNRGCEIELVDPSDFVVESLQVVHLDKYFKVVRS
ncbi:MAG: hypothetical protein KY476_05090 [Planctomycetes bacterium]|nr:hypothetical protein [Planctomycetota bacterium]